MSAQTNDTDHQLHQSKELVAVDLFCGVGGLTHGFVLAKVRVVAGIDIDESCKYAYETNNEGAQFVCKNLSTTRAADINLLYPPNCARILMGCAPCQPFSSNTGSGKRRKRHKDYGLLRSFARIVQAIQPEYVSMENVPLLRKEPIYDIFVSLLQRWGYQVWSKVIYCPNYGVAQRRKRLVLLAAKSAPIELISPTHAEDTPTVESVIGHLEAIAAGEVSKTDPLHRAANLSPLNLQRIAATPEGGGWGDWPPELVLDCHKKKSGKSYGSVYGRMKWSEPAATMTTQCCGLGNGRFGHPEQNRAISLREAAIFQSFPETYQFFPTDRFPSFDQLEKHIGNAVPVALGKAIAQSIKIHSQ